MTDEQLEQIKKMIEGLREKIHDLEYDLEIEKIRAKQSVEEKDLAVKSMRGYQEKLREQNVYAEFYKQLQEGILKNPTLLDEWQRFCVMLKLTDPDHDKYQDIRLRSQWFL